MSQGFTIDPGLVSFASLLAGYNADGGHVAYTGDLDDILDNSVYFITPATVTNEPAEMVTASGTVHTDWNDVKSAAIQIVHSVDVGDFSVPWHWQRLYSASVWGAWRFMVSGALTFNSSNLATFSGGVYAKAGLGWFDSIRVDGDNGVGGGNISIIDTNPYITWHESDAALDEKYWMVEATAGNLQFKTLTDAAIASEVWLQVTRTADAVTAVNIAGDAVNISGAFSSLGIDDNATGERLQLADGSVIWGVSGTTWLMYHKGNDALVSLSGGSSSTAGSNIRLYGGTHASQANDLQFRADSNVWMKWDESAGDLEISTGTGVKTSALVISSTQLATFSGSIEIEGTYLGIRNTGATSIQLEDTDNGFAATVLSIGNGGRDFKISAPQDIRLETDSITALTLDNIQDAYFAGDIDMSSGKPIIYMEDSNSGATALGQAMAGISMVSTGMNTTNKYSPALSFGTNDPEITDKGGLCHIVGYSTQTQSSASAAGFGIEIWTNPNNVGYAPVLALKIDNNQKTTFSNDIGFSNANPIILGNDANGVILLGPSTGSTLGGNIALYGESHSSVAGDINLRSGSSNKLKSDDSDDQWETSAGFNFPVAVNANSNANTLDDYEEGTWTPVLSDGTNDATGNTIVGRYTKVGNIVHFQGKLTTSSLGSVSGALRIKGLPFPAANITELNSPVAMSEGSSLSMTASVNVTGNVLYNQSYITLWAWDNAAGVTTFGAFEWTANGGMSFSGSYRV